MKIPDLLARFATYQRERFPLAVLVFTTLSVVLSSFAVSSSGPVPWSTVAVATFASLLFLLHTRVIDEFRDKRFDDEFHASRPVQRGLISLRELARIDVAAGMVQLALLFFVPSPAAAWIFVAYLYTALTANDFFVADWIRERFVLYNMLNLLQLLFLQIYLYAVFGVRVQWSVELAVHFVFVLANAVVLEVARKLRLPSNESAGRDTYSARYGVAGAAVVFLGACVLASGLFAWLYLLVGQVLWPALVAAAALLVCVGLCVGYVLQRVSGSALQAGAVLLYLCLHGMLVVGVAW